VHIDQQRLNRVVGILGRVERAQPVRDLGMEAGDPLNETLSKTVHGRGYHLSLR